eukprot:m.67107 g.67107  ORF g.67107 m.67107 type:complete len:345 (+) comp14092_c0_seq1:27-1061(+)
MFVDLNIPAIPGDVRNAKLIERLSMLAKLGYDGAAVTDTFTGRITATAVSSAPSPLPLDDEAQSALTIGRRTFKQYTRATVVLADAKESYSLNGTNPYLKAFDVVAVQPATEKLFSQVCSSLDVDIITLDLSKRLPYFLKMPPIGQAVERGIFFEIAYSAALTDSTARRNLISNAQALVRACKGRNLIITSEAASAFAIRGPYDIANFATLFGLSISAAKQALAQNTRSVLLHGSMRSSTYRGVLAVQMPPAGTATTTEASAGAAKKQAAGAKGQSVESASSGGGGKTKNVTGKPSSAKPSPKEAASKKAAALADSSKMVSDDDDDEGDDDNNAPSLTGLDEDD